jgi:hypothetical protein
MNRFSMPSRKCPAVGLLPNIKSIANPDMVAIKHKEIQSWVIKV